MDFIDDDISWYCEKNTSEESDSLKELNRHTNTNVLRPRMLSGHLQGKLLEMLSCMIQPSRVLEIGTYTGYSAICLAKGVKENGILITVDKNEELQDSCNEFFDKAGFKDKIKMEVGNAMELIPEMNHVFDLVFIDADKENYLNYYNLIIDKVPSGGYVIADNVLWSGKVVQPLKSGDKETKALLDFNHAITADVRVENVLLPFRDGLMILRKL